MRSKTVVPVGQGCRKKRFADKLPVTLKYGCCMCHPDMYLNRCLACGDRFHTYVPHTKTCDDKCRKRLSRMRHEKLFQTMMSFT